MCLRECTAYRLLLQLGMLLELRRCTIANPIPCGVTHPTTEVQSHLGSEFDSYSYWRECPPKVPCVHGTDTAGGCCGAHGQQEPLHEQGEVCCAFSKPQQQLP